MPHPLSSCAAAVTVVVACGLLQVDEAGVLAVPGWLGGYRSPTRASSVSLALASTSSRGSGGSDPWAVTNNYDVVNYSSVPTIVMASPDCWYSTTSLDDSMCAIVDFGANSSHPDEVPTEFYSSRCAPDLASYLDETFGDVAYLRFDFYNSTNCTDSAPKISNALVVDGLCHAGLVVNDTTEEIVISAKLTTLNANGSVTIRQFGTGDCSGEPQGYNTVSRELLATNECYDHVRTYTNADLGDAETGEAGEEGEDRVIARGSGLDGASAFAAGSFVGAATAAIALLIM